MFLLTKWPFPLSAGAIFLVSTQLLTQNPPSPHDLPPGTQGNQHRGWMSVTPGAAGTMAARGTVPAFHNVSVDTQDLIQILKEATFYLFLQDI